MMRKNSTIALFFLLFTTSPFAQPLKTKNVILVTLDGFRWQEVFNGADSSLLFRKKYVKNTEDLTKKFWGSNAEARRNKLLPFFWNTIARDGQLIGNREQGCKMNVTNRFWFSYPGYNEILTGLHRDFLINTNQKRNNPNTTILEMINQQPGFNGKVAAFGSWDLFPYIINEDRCKIPINSGYCMVKDDELTDTEKLLNQLQNDIPHRWNSVRFDAFTYYYAMEYLKKEKPSFLYIGFGETDDFAHDGCYDQYLLSANRTDRFISDLWNQIQSDEFYRDKTTLIITTDHGRGRGVNSWKTHGRQIFHSGEVWMAVLGPDTPALGELNGDCQFYTNQIANTILSLMGLDKLNMANAGRRMDSVISGSSQQMAVK